LVQDGRNGLLVNAGNVEELTTALAGLLQNAEQRSSLRVAARHTIDTRYNFATRMQRLKCIYDELLRK
jgi:glycosyltransferase involved in cell wall biosynthesis